MATAQAILAQALRPESLQVKLRFLSSPPCGLAPLSRGEGDFALFILSGRPDPLCPLHPCGSPVDRGEIGRGRPVLVLLLPPAARRVGDLCLWACGDFGVETAS